MEKINIGVIGHIRQEETNLTEIITKKQEHQNCFHEFRTIDSKRLGKIDVCHLCKAIK